MTESSYHDQRIQVFSQAFDSIISEFTSYAPVLSQIKTEYDKIIFAKESDKAELVQLRSRVKNLENQNENRLMLDFERKRREALQNKLIQLNHQNDQMRIEFRRKVTMLAGFLPESVLALQKSEDPELVVEETEEGMDPICMLESKILLLEKAVWRTSLKSNDYS